MLAKRIVARLDVTDGRLTRAPENQELVANDPIELCRYYDAAGADELILFDRGMTADRTFRFEDLVERVAREVFLPLTVGGGVVSHAHIRSMLRAGGDRVLLQSHAVRDPNFLREAIERFGPERIVVGIEAIRRKPAADDPREPDYVVAIENGTKVLDRLACEWAAEVSGYGPGEILLTSLERTETRRGFDLEWLQRVLANVDVPVLIRGGAGAPEHFVEALTDPRVAGAVAAEIFHHKEASIRRVKRACQAAGLPVRQQGDEMHERLQGEAAGRLPDTDRPVRTPDGPTPDWTPEEV